MAQPQKNGMVMAKDSPEWDVIADDWVEVDVNMDYDADEFDQAKPNNNNSIIESQNHVTPPPATAEIKNTSGSNENSSEPNVVTRYIDVPEDLVRFFTGKDVVMDLQIASGAMIQLTKAYDVDAKYRPVRLIGNSENVDKAETLIKAVVALADAGGTVLLRKNDCDHSYDYGTKYANHKKQESYQSHNYSILFPEHQESWGPFQFDRKHSHKRSHGRR